jgi:hypothetical protein
MINFNYRNDFSLSNNWVLSAWLSAVILSEEKEGGNNYIFVMMNIYIKLNVEYLDHDTLTDISLITLWVMKLMEMFYFYRTCREDIKDLRFLLMKN